MKALSLKPIASRPRAALLYGAGSFLPKLHVRVMRLPPPGGNWIFAGEA